MPTSSATHRTYSFGEFTLDLDRGALLRAGADIKLRPKSFEVLSYLIERQGLLVTKDELLDAIWGRTVVTEDATTQCLSDIRRALRDQSQEMIRTVPRRGYIFDLPVTKHGGLGTASGVASRSRFISSWPRWRLSAALVLILGLAAVWWAFGNRLAEVPAIIEPFSIVAPHSIAVLPFVNMSPDPEQEYFSDGISEEILNLLTRIPGLKVIGRTSSFAFKGKNENLRAIGQKLGVKTVLEGSVRRSGDRVRITAQLVNVSDGTIIWSESYDNELDDVFAIQDEIAAAVVNTLKITLLGESPKTTVTNPEAYALYLQGQHFQNQFTAESIKQAETLLKQALKIDAGFAPAWTELGSVYWLQAGMFGFRPIDEAYELARHAIQTALTIDPQNGWAYAALAMVEMYYDWDFVMALQHLQRAMALDPGNPSILLRVSNLNTLLGRVDESIDRARQMVALDPVSPAAHFRLGRTLYHANRLEEAVVSLQMSLSLSPKRFAGQYTLGWVLLAQGDAPAALEAMKQEPTDAFRLAGTAVVQYALHDAPASNAALLELIEKYAELRAFQIAQVYAFRGDIDEAFRWLERAYNNHDRTLTGILTQPLLANLHDDPRWEPFLDKMGLVH